MQYNKQRLNNNRRRLSAPLSLALTIALSTALSAPAHASQQQIKAGDLIPNKYIVTLDERMYPSTGFNQVHNTLTRAMSQIGYGKLGHVYQHTIRGGVVYISPWQASILRKLPGIKHVEQDRVVTAVGTASQSSAPWSLDRIDQSDLPLNSTYTYPESAGTGVNVYILDTGIRSDHQEFSGRLKAGKNFAINGGYKWDIFGFFDWTFKTDPNNTEDCEGHGTHVASSAAGVTYGVAKRASVIPVRVLNCRGAGSNSDVIAGVDWVAANHVKPAVANMSLGGGSSTALDTAVKAAVASGMTMVVAAGNDNKDACNGSPNRVPEAITVGSSTKTDTRSSFSNWGSCVDIFAPGSDITAAGISNSTSTSNKSGTSMAAPHVAGAAAVVLGKNASLAPAQVDLTIKNYAVLGKLTNINTGSPNRLLNVNNMDGIYQAY